MIKRLLILSLILIPFYEVVLYFFIPGRVFPEFPDMRITKDFVSLASCLGIGSVVLCSEGFKKLKNIWIPIFLTLMLIGIYKAPFSNVMFLKNNWNGMWNWEPAFKLFAYFFLFLSVSSIKLSSKDIHNIFKTIAYSGVVMSVLMIMQYFGVDQIFKVYADNNSFHKSMGGTIGQPTLCAPFVVMSLPFLIFLRKWLLSIIAIAAVVLSGSAFAIGGMSVCLFALSISFVKREYKVNLSVLFASLSVLILFLIKKYYPALLVDSGRFGMWKDVFNIILHDRIALTGAGIGSFKYLYALRTGNDWYHAHNEYLEILWSCGALGFLTFIMMFKKIMFHVKQVWCDETKVLLACLLGICAIAMGTFVMQLAVYQFYLTVIAGVLYSMLATKETCYGNS